MPDEDFIRIRPRPAFQPFLQLAEPADVGKTGGGPDDFDLAVVRGRAGLFAGDDVVVDQAARSVCGFRLQKLSYYCHTGFSVRRKQVLATD